MSSLWFERKDSTAVLPGTFIRPGCEIEMSVFVSAWVIFVWKELCTTDLDQGEFVDPAQG